MVAENSCDFLREPLHGEGHGTGHQSLQDGKATLLVTWYRKKRKCLFNIRILTNSSLGWGNSPLFAY